MKPLIFLFFAIAATYLQGQTLKPDLPPASQVAKEFRPTYRRLVVADEQRRATLERQGFDIILPAESQVPTFISDANALNQTNWGRDALASGLAARMASECLFPVVVKVADTGGKLSHPDLQTGQLAGSSYTGEAAPEDGNGHSTHCAGIIAAQGLGIAWPIVSSGKLKFKPVKILTDGGGGSFSWVQNAYATERSEDVTYRQQGVAVLYTNSFGGGTSIIQPVETEIEKSVQAGVYFAFANGNTGAAVNYPAMSPLAISVASLDQSMVVSSYSSRGPETDLAMPGRNINSTYKGNTYAVLSGTSMATPFAAAAGAIALSKWGMQKLPTQAALAAYLQKIATDIPPSGFDPETGFGAVFIRAILDTPPTGTPPPPPPPPVDPPTPKVAAATVVDAGYMQRWTLQGSNTPRLLRIIEVHLFVEETSAEKSIEAAKAWCDRFFPNNQIVDIPAKNTPEGGLLGAGYWAGQFLEYFAKNNGGALQVQKLVVADETGRKFEVMGFDRAEVPSEYGVQAGPKYVPVK